MTTFDNLLFSSSYYPESLTLGNRTVSDANGEFIFTGVFVDYPLMIKYCVQHTSEQVSPVDVGDDETIDSDFYLRFNPMNTYHTDGFIIEEGGEKTDIGLGIKE